nr:conserved uncharacterized protein [uncultured bacterium]
MADFLDDALSILARVAPTLASMIGGPFAGQAVAAIESALGLDPNGDKDAALKAVCGCSPEQLAALKAEDNRHAEVLQKLGLDAEALAVQDRDGARKMQTDTKAWTPPALAVCITVGFFGVLAWTLNNGLPTAGGEAVLVLLGALGSAWGAVVNFYFGSSVGSARKDQIIAMAPPPK